MAIYRPPKPRWPAAIVAGLAGLAVGIVAGLTIAGGEADPVEGAAVVRRELASAAARLEVVAVEYDEAVEDGEVVAEGEYGGARDALAASRAAFESVRPALEALAPDRSAEIARRLTALDTAVAGHIDPAEVDSQVAALADLLLGR